MAIETIRHVLEQSIELRERVRKNVHLRDFAADDIEMEAYNDLVSAAIIAVPNDFVLSKLVLMPDANLQWRSMQQNLPAETASKRLEAKLTQLINRLEIILGERHQDTRQSEAKKIIPEEQPSEVKEILATLSRIEKADADLPSVQDLSFGFVSDTGLQSVLKCDYREAQLALSSHAYKGAALLASGVIEGMLLDMLSSEAATQHCQYAAATSSFPKVADEINWDRVSLAPMIGAAQKLELIGKKILLFAEAVPDVRDTIHPRAEVRSASRPEREEAKLLLALAELIHREITSAES